MVVFRNVKDGMGDRMSEDITCEDITKAYHDAKTQMAKEKALADNGYEIMVGYCFSTPPACEEDCLTFVEQKEAEAVFAKGPVKYWWNESHERLYDLDQAWDCFYDDYHNSHPDVDLSEEEFDKLMGVK